MGKCWRCGVAAAAVGLGVHGAWAQTAVPLERLVVGTWAVSGTTNCLQSSTGFTSNMSPAIPPASTPPVTAFVTQLGGTFIGTRTFNADGTGRSIGITHALGFPGTFHGMQIVGVQPNGDPIVVPFAGVGSQPPNGGASTATLDATFTWAIQSDGTLLIDDDGMIPQSFTAPPSLVGTTVTIENVPPFVGYVSKDRSTIVMTHPGMSIETSVTRDVNGLQRRTPRFCTRHRVLTRLD